MTSDVMGPGGRTRVGGGAPATGGSISVDDPRRPDVTALLERHLAFSASETPPEHSFALDVEGLADPAITFFSFRDESGQLLGIGALKLMGNGAGELKSMHTAARARGRGVGRAIVARIIATARERGLHRLYLETGTTAGFAAARVMYASAGFEPCGPFGGYPVTGDNTFRTLALD